SSLSARCRGCPTRRSTRSSFARRTGMGAPGKSTDQVSQAAMNKKDMTAAAKNGLRRQILDESAKLFIAHGFNGTTINHIAVALHVTLTNIYYYFKDKREILEELTGDVFLTGRMIARKAAEPHTDPVVALRALVEVFARVILSNPIRFRVIERNEGYLGQEVRAKVAAARKKLFNDFRSVIQEGISAGAFRPVDAG